MDQRVDERECVVTADFGGLGLGSGEVRYFMWLRISVESFCFFTYDCSQGECAISVCVTNEKRGRA